MFINRQAEIAFLSNENVGEQERSRLIFVTGPSGVGKSALVDHWLGIERARIHFHVQVENHFRNRDEDRLFLTRLAGAMVATSKTDQTVPTFGGTLRKVYEPKALQAFCTLLAEQFDKRRPGIGAEDVLDKVTSAIMSGAKDLPEALTPELELYVQHVVQRVPTLIRVENAQLLDRRSHSFFLNLFAESGGLFGIFEVTGTQTDDPASDLASSFAERQVKVGVLPIRKLDLDEIVHGLRDRPQQVVQLISRSYANSDGNLHPLQLLTNHSDRGLVHSFHDVTYAGLTRRMIESMPRAEQVLVVAVVVHAGAVQVDLARAFFASPTTLQRLALEEFDLSATVGILVERLFLAHGTGAIRVRHDSIISSASEIDRLRAMTRALEAAWRDFYQSVHHGNEDFFLSKSEVLDWLTYFNARLQDTVQTLKCLEEIGRLAFNSVAPSRLVQHLATNRDRLARVGGRQARLTLDQLYRQQALLLYEAGWFDEALECVSLIEESDTSCVLLMAELYCSQGQAEQGIRLAARLMTNLDGDARLSADLIRVHGLRMLDRFGECRDLYLSLLAMDGVQASPLYPTLLRFSDLALNLDSDQSKCVELLEESVRIAIGSGLERDAALARMALVQQLGYMGRFNDVQHHLDAIEESASRVWIQRYPLINNRAVLSLFQGGSTTEALRLLSQALILCSEFHDRLIVRNNQLVANCLAARAGAAENSLEALLKTLRGPDEVELEIKKIVLFNISRGFAHLDRAAEGKPFLDQARVINTGMDVAYWDFVLHGGPRPTASPAREQLGFYPIFLSHWYLSSTAFERAV